MPISPLPRQVPGTGRAQALLLGVLLVFAPLLRGGNDPLALMTLELLALALLVAVLWRRPPGLVRTREALVLLALAAFPLLYLVPISADLLAWLPGRDRYLEGLRLVGDGTLPTTLRPSLAPFATEAAWLVLLLPITVFLAVRSLPTGRVLLLIKILLGMAALQATLGLMQFGGGRDSGLYLGMTFTHFDSAVGTYTNRNHLAGLMEMVLPISLALLLYSVGRDASEAGGTSRKQRWRRRLSFFASVRGHAAFAYGALALLVLVGAIFSRSRAGIALAILGTLLAVGLFSRRLGGNNVYGPAGTLVVIAIGLGVAIGLVPVLDRFSVAGALTDARWPMFSATLDGIGAFFPLGSGPGTFPDVFPAFQPVELGRWFVNRAHNDYLEWLFEGGIGAALLILLLAGLYLLQCGLVLKASVWSRFRFVQVGAGIGLLLLALHETVDYNLHTPANLIYFAFLAGVFFSNNERDQEEQQGKSPRRTPRMDLAGQVTPTTGVVTPAAPSPDQIRNPFLD